ncbi:MAG: hypothetical protein AAF959_15395 [Cyanobacteria bacterium P01_D01_bin.56]
MCVAIRQATRYLLKEAIQPIPGEQTTLAVWARPDIHNTTKPLQAKLDGAGTGLLALLSLHSLQQEIVPLDYLQSLGRFIVYMQRGEESFYSRYIPMFGGKMLPQSLQHYPMEAALGLIMLYEKDSNKIWLETACTIMSRLMGNGQPASIADISPWTLLVVAKLLSLIPEDSMSMSRELLIAYAMQTCKILLQEQVNTPRQPHYDGGFSRDGIVTPTAAWIEGLLATLKFLPANDSLASQIRNAVTRGIKFLLQAQIRDGEWVGAIPRAVGPLQSRRAAKTYFNRRATEVRIDYVQYAMRAWMKYVSLAPGLGIA